MKPVLQFILVLGLIGLIASGILSYQDLSAHSCKLCKLLPRNDLILGYPPVFYAFALYALITVLSALGLRAKR